jgi:hypothetical protein
MRCGFSGEWDVMMVVVVELVVELVVVMMVGDEHDVHDTAPSKEWVAETS